MSSAPNIARSGLPEPIRQRLKAVISRVRGIQLLKGLFATAAALVISLLCVMAVDWAFNVESQTVRWALSLVALAVTLITFCCWVVRPMSRKISLTNVARWVELHHPEMEERISTAVDLSGRSDAGSRQLIDEIVKEAVSDAAHLNPRQELTVKAARRPIWTAGVAGALLGLLFLLFPSVAPMLLARAVAPFAKLGNARALQVRFLTPDKQTVIAGDAFSVEAAGKNARGQRAVIILEYPNGEQVREQMNEDGGVKAVEDETGYAFRLPTLPPQQQPNP
jgi:hypothetical protein